MSHGFSVTYERFFPHEEDEDICEADESGFVIENVSLRDAIRETSCYASDANEYPIESPRWFDFYEWSHDYASGTIEDRALHVPNHVTPASRRRIARLLHLRV